MLLASRFFFISGTIQVFRRPFTSMHRRNQMDTVTSTSEKRKHATLRLCRVSGFMTELLELRSEDPLMHIVFIPGNPGIVSFYNDFLGAVYELLKGRASVTAIGYISQTEKNWERGKLFSLQDQINHKVDGLLLALHQHPYDHQETDIGPVNMDFIKQEFENTEIPIMLVGHSLGSYIALETFKRFPQLVIYAICLYPFLTLNKESAIQSTIWKFTKSQVLCTSLSCLAALLGLFPIWASRALVKKYFGKSWSDTAVEAACGHLLQYHTVRNALFMANSEFDMLSEEPNWRFIGERRSQIAFLFGIDDHWGPLSLFEEISKQVPGVALSIEKEGHTHDFCCREASSLWVANHVVSLIRSIPIGGQYPALF